MPNPEKQVMSAQTLHKRPPKLHLGHEETTASADEINNSNNFNQCNIATVGMASSPSTPTTPSTPSSPAISKPPKKRYLENGSFRCTGDDQNPSQMANLMELAKVCSNTTKASGSCHPGNKATVSVADFPTNVNSNYAQTQATLSDISVCRTSSYNQIPIFDVDIAGRIRDSDLFETRSSSPSGSPAVCNSRPEEPLNLCTDKKTITTCQQDLISRMVDKFFCDPNESKGTLLDSFLSRMNSHKKLSYCDKNNKTVNKSDTNCSDGEVECVGSYKTAKLNFNDKTGPSRNSDKSLIHYKKENCAEEEEKSAGQKKSQNNSSQNVNASSKMVTISDKWSNAGDDWTQEINHPSKEGQRKSQRSSKGKRYQAFLTEGFLHPPKERKPTRRNNSEELAEADKSAKETEVKPVGKSNKKRKPADIRQGKSATKETATPEEMAREESRAEEEEEEEEAQPPRKTKKRSGEGTEGQNRKTWWQPGPAERGEETGPEERRAEEERKSGCEEDERETGPPANCPARPGRTEPEEKTTPDRP